MPEHPSGNDDATLPTEAGIESDDTLAHDPARPTPPQVSTGRVIRVSRHSLAPDRLGRYTIVRALGRGGMGEVYEADDPELGRRVAIKVLRDDRDDPRSTEQLRREAQALAKLVHANVVSVYDVGVEDQRVFLVMQLVDGESIDRWLRARHAGAAEIVAAFRQAGRGLAAAHAAGLVHCDFKPGNVLVDKDGAVRVTDFGIARIGADEDGAIAGTPSYMAPEQFAGIATAASDQYAFCVALYEVLAGAPPFPESKIQDAEAAAARVVPEMPRSARVPARVVRALQRGLAPDPARRFATVNELLAALAAPVRRRMWIAAAIGACLLAGGVVVALAARPAPEVASPPQEAPLGEPDLAAKRALTHFGRAGCAYAPAIDGDRIVYDRAVGEAYDLYVMPLAGGAERQLTSSPAWEWRAHAGRRAGEVIHLVTDPSEKIEPNISYLDLATSHDELASPLAAADAISTSRGIVYVVPGGAEMRRTDGVHDVVLATAPKGTAFDQLSLSRRGDRLAVITVGNPGDRPCIVDLVLGKLACFDSPAMPARPAFGTDDRSVYYTVEDGIHRRELATGRDALIVPDVVAFGGIAISDDGSRLVYSDCGTRAQLVDWSTRPPTVLLDDPMTSAPRVEGDTLLFLRHAHGTAAIVVRDRAGHERQVTDPTFGSAANPAISPDGTLVAFHSGPPHEGIYVTPIARRMAMTRISDDVRDQFPVWVGDDWLAFSRMADRDDARVYVARADGSELHQLSGASRFALGGRDGRVLVTSSALFYWVDLATGKETRGPDIDLGATSGTMMSPNGMWLLVHLGTQAHLLYRMHLDGSSKPEKLPELPADATLAGTSITDDGHVLVAPNTWSGDLYSVPAKPGTRF